MNWFFSCRRQYRAAFQQNLGQAGWKEDAMVWQGNPAEQSTDLGVTLSMEHSWVRPMTGVCLCSVPASTVRVQGKTSAWVLSKPSVPCRHLDPLKDSQRQTFPKTGAEFQSYLVCWNASAVWTCFLPQEAGSCLLPHKLNWKLEHVLLHTMAACGPVPPQADPRVPGRNLTGFSFNILAPLLPLLLYIYSKKIKHHNKKLFPRDLI